MHADRTDIQIESDRTTHDMQSLHIQIRLQIHSQIPILAQPRCQQNVSVQIHVYVLWCVWIGTTEYVEVRVGEGKRLPTR